MKARILVVDDSLTVRTDLQYSLESAGLAVTACGSAAAARAALANGDFELIILDIVLPDADGTDFLRELRASERTARIPVLLLSSEAAVRGRMHGSTVGGISAGAIEYVGKPYDRSHVLARINRLISTDAAPASHAKSLLGAKRILAVDDSATYLMALAAPLREDGHDVITAISGEQALALLPVQSIDCILLDLTMPGLSGQETCRRIKESVVWRSIPLLMLTAREDREAMLDSFDAGADDYIAKSSEFGVLKVRLRAQLRRKQFEDENSRIREELVRKEIEAAEARANRELAEERGRLLVELKRTNEELESFSYSVSHDLRAPLRSISGFSKILLETGLARLDDQGMDCLNRVVAATKKMEKLIDGLLSLSKLSRTSVRKQQVNLSHLATEISQELKRIEPSRNVDFVIAEDATAACDPDLARIVIQNLLANAWKYTSKHPSARIEFNIDRSGDKTSFFVKDDGAGFDMSHASQLFSPFQRLHTDREFEGTGIGLATVKRIVTRHGGEIWVKASPGQGASFHFTLQAG